MMYANIYVNTYHAMYVHALATTEVDIHTGYRVNIHTCTLWGYIQIECVIIL